MKHARLLLSLTLALTAGCAAKISLPLNDPQLGEAREAIKQARQADAEQCAPALQAKAVASLYWAAHEITEEEYHPDENASLIANAVRYARQAEAKAKKMCWRLEGVHFAFDSAELTPDSRTTLDDAVAKLKKARHIRVEIAAHTDSIGTEDYNLKLSERRAKAVFDYFVTHGIDGSRLTVKGYGESQPVASNDTKEGRALNRRVELRVQQ